MTNCAATDFFVQIYYTIKTDLEKQCDHNKLCKISHSAICGRSRRTLKLN